MFTRVPTRQVLHLRNSLAFKGLRRDVLLRSSHSTTPQPSPVRTGGKILRQTVATAAVLIGGSLFAVYYFDSRSAIHRYVLTPLIRNVLDPEDAHKVAVKVLRSGLAPRDMALDDEWLSAELWDEMLSNPIGLAAGFDKNGEAIDGLFDLGFSWVEIGSVTPKPQPGNPKPRVFHLPEDNAIINRYGFPSDGALSVLSRLKARLPSIFSPQSSISGPTLSPIPGIHHTEQKSESEKRNASLRPRSLLAINLGKNKISPVDSSDDFVEGIRLFGQYADVLVVNISSPNTPGLRSMQSSSVLKDLLSTITRERDALPAEGQVLTNGRKPKLVIKIAPDLSEKELKDVAKAITDVQGIDGIIVSNTTIQRPSTLSADPRNTEPGGLSGPPLKPLTLHAIRTLRPSLPPSIPIIACGGVSSGKDALEYAKAGASLVQMYTHFAWDGVGAVRRVKDELGEELAREGRSWNEVVSGAVGGGLCKEGERKVEKGEEVEKVEELVGGPIPSSSPDSVTGTKNNDDDDGSSSSSSKPDHDLDTSMKALISEAHAIRDKIDELGERMAKEGDIVSASSVVP